MCVNVVCVCVCVCAEQSKVAPPTSYLDLLRALNVGVSKWISNHVEKNPYVDLTPIFRDYEKHLETIDLKVQYTHQNTLVNSTLVVQ